MTGSISSIKKIHILIATYKRPEHLRRLLDSLANLKTDNITVAISVIDNDPEQTARRITANFPQVEYKSELQPGIPSARNASLDCMQSDDDAIVFIDDDEFVPPSWAQELVLAAQYRSADVVTGPVRPHFPDSTPSWIVSGNFWERTSHTDGAEVERVATNNTLVMCALLRDNPSIRFQERFKNTGGSDTQFFMDLASVTTKYVWAEKAFVYESVLPERANAAWLFRRAIRIGNVNARYAPSVVQPLIGGATRIIAGAAYSAGLLLVRGRVNAKSFNMLGHGVGLIGHTLKRDVQEYK